MNDPARGRRAFTRALAVLVLIGAFVATEQIDAGRVDALLAVGLAIASVVAFLAAILAFRARADEGPTLVSVVEAGVFVAGALTIFGIFRTVIPDTSSFQADPILGLGLVLLVLFVWRVTEGGSTFGIGAASGRRAAVPGAAAGSPGGGDGGGGGGGDSGAGPGGQAPDAGGTNEGGNGGAASTIARLTPVGALIATVVVALYALLIYGLWQNVSASAESWARMVEIQSGLESAAFAALGALLGVTIQGRTTDRVAQEARDAKDEAASNAGDAGDAIAIAADALELAGGTAPSETEAFRVMGMRPGDEERRRSHAALEERLRAVARRRANR